MEGRSFLPLKLAVWKFRIVEISAIPLRYVP